MLWSCETSEYSKIVCKTLDTLNVTIAVYLSDIQVVSVENMDFLIDLYLTEVWKDPRLAFDPKQLGLGNKASIITLGKVNIGWWSMESFPNPSSSSSSTQKFYPP